MAPEKRVPIFCSKIDLKDGYWKMVVNAKEACSCSYVLPPLSPIDSPELFIPDALQMGWSESSPLFCSVTEIARDIAESYYKSGKRMPPHSDENTVLDIN